jgi:golgi-specific brefeldin A-resistance guanine nucleotide exchange factor 1
MTIDDYRRNLRGENAGTDFSPEFLVRSMYELPSEYSLVTMQQSIYDSIRKREIVLPEEHTGQLGFEYAWKELLIRSKQAGSTIHVLY